MVSESRVLTYEPAHSDLLPGGWVRIRWHGRRPDRPFPPICVCCLQPTEQRHSFNMNRTGTEVLSVGLCESCEHYWAKRRRRFFLLALFPLIAISIALFLTVEPYSKKGEYFAFGLASGAFTLGLIIIKYLSLRFATFIQMSGWPLSDLYVRFRNAAFVPIYLGFGSNQGRSNDK
jgi:hypothetical protein